MEIAIFFGNLDSKTNCQKVLTIFSLSRMRRSLHFAEFSTCVFGFQVVAIKFLHQDLQKKARKTSKNIKWMGRRLNFAEVSTYESGFRVALEFLDLSLLQPQQRDKHSSPILF